MKKRSIILVLIAFMALPSLGKSAKKVSANDTLALQGKQSAECASKGSLYLELFGNGVIYSIGYDRVFGRANDLVKFSLTGGVSAYSDFSTIHVVYLTPQVSCLVGRGKHQLEVGLGRNFPLSKYPAYYTHRKIDSYYYLSFIRFGYRYRLNDILYIKAGFTPYMIMHDLWHSPFRDSYYPWGGIAVGWSL